MDAATPFTGPTLEPIDRHEFQARRDSGRTLVATATFQLSEEGRKASLLDGGDGKAIQKVTIHVPTSRFHLVSVDTDGVARLKLQPRYYLDPNQNVMRSDAPPTYDAPPTLEDLLKNASRNHQLERAFLTDQAETRSKRRDALFEKHQTLAERFLADPTLRALEHPKPTPRQCHLRAGRRPMLFDAKAGHGLARQVPPEAYRRFQADFLARRERNQEKRARELVVHDERERAIAAWVARHGTPDQQQRHDAGVLPLKEALDGMADEAFAAAAHLPRYLHDGVERLQAHLRQFPKFSSVVLSKADLEITSENVDEATEPQWALKNEIESLIPNADCSLRMHRLSLKGDLDTPSLFQRGVLVTAQVGLFVLRREYLVTNVSPVHDDPV